MSNDGATVGYEAQLWQMAGALRGSMDAAEYKRVVLPPFNVSDWGGERLREDRRWAYNLTCLARLMSSNSRGRHAPHLR